MFERYTEKARRAVFFARYEASCFGSPMIETEHFLLGLLREDRVLRSLLGGYEAVDALRKKVEAFTPHRPKVSTSVDLPLASDLQSALAGGAGRADSESSRHIDTHHLVLGLLDEKGCCAARLLREAGVDEAALLDRIQNPQAGQPHYKQQVTMHHLRLLIAAADEAETRGEIFGIEHLLLAIAREGSSMAAEILRDSGLTIEKLREEIDKRRNIQA